MIQPQCRHNLFFKTEELAEKAKAWVEDHNDLTNFYGIVDCYVTRSTAEQAPYECAFFTENFFQEDTISLVEQECQPEDSEFNFPPDAPRGLGDQKNLETSE